MTLKLNIVGRRRPGTTLAEHRRHIRDVHGELVLRFIRTDAMNAPQRYVQNPVHDGAYRASARGSDPLALGCDFVTQIWVADFGALERSRKTDFYLTHLQGDEDRFVDPSTVIFLPSHEREIASTGPVATGAWKLFVLFQRAPGVEPAAFSSAWARAAQIAPRVALRHVQNDVLGRPGAELPADAIDEFWFDEEAAAHAHLTTWQGVLHASLIRPGLALAGSVAVVIAREDVIHAGAA
jgi:vanillate O-demethylase ferredoxin subunit